MSAVRSPGRLRGFKGGNVLGRRVRAAAVRAFRAPVELLDLPEPDAGPGELLIRIEAAGMNPFDWEIADGLFEGARPHRFPLVLGVDGAGVVEDLGEGTTGFARGDRLVGSFLHDPVGVGTYAEHTTVPETNALVRVPADLRPSLAAALPTAGMAALQALDLLEVPKGGWVVLVGASGGVGSIAIQLARSRGAQVLAVARSSSHERLRALGASATLELTAWGAPELRRLAGPSGFDGLLDLVSDADGFSRWAQLLRPRAVAISSVGAAREVPGRRSVSLDMRPSSRDLERLLREVARGSLSLSRTCTRTIRLEEVPVALQESRAGTSSGKTVLSLEP